MGAIVTAIVVALGAAALPRGAASGQLGVTAVVVRSAVIPIPTATAGAAASARRERDDTTGAERAAAAAAGSPVIFPDGAPPSFTVRARTERAVSPALALGAAR